MQFSTQKCLSKQSSSEPPINMPPEWYNWFAQRSSETVAYVQDVVHVAVKLKARLLTETIILPMGKHVAGVHDLHLIQNTFGKDQHGLRQKNVSHKNKQNFDVVLHIVDVPVSRC